MSNRSITPLVMVWLILCAANAGCSGPSGNARVEQHRDEIVHGAKPIQLEVRSASFELVSDWTRESSLGTGRPIWIDPEPFLTWNDVIDATLRTDTRGRPVIELAFNEPAANRLEHLTRERINQPIAIFLDDVFLMSPVVRSPIRRLAITHASSQGPNAEARDEVFTRLKMRLGDD